MRENLPELYSHFQEIDLATSMLASKVRGAAEFMLFIFFFFFCCVSGFCVSSSTPCRPSRCFVYGIVYCAAAVPTRCSRWRLARCKVRTHVVGGAHSSPVAIIAAERTRLLASEDAVECVMLLQTALKHRFDVDALWAVAPKVSVARVEAERARQARRQARAETAALVSVSGVLAKRGAKGLKVMRLWKKRWFAFEPQVELCRLFYCAHALRPQLLPRVLNRILVASSCARGRRGACGRHHAGADHHRGRGRRRRRLSVFDQHRQAHVRAARRIGARQDHVGSGHQRRADVDWLHFIKKTWQRGFRTTKMNCDRPRRSVCVLVAALLVLAASQPCRVVFTTQSLHNGAGIGGVTGADSKCQSEAQSSGVQRVQIALQTASFKAWIR